MINKIFKFVITFNLIGCSGGAGLMTNMMQSWQGSGVDEVVAQWGFPHDEQNFANRKVLIWYRNAQVITPGFNNSTGTTTLIGNTAFYSGTTINYGRGVMNGSCVRKLEIDSNNKVISWQWEGNNCPFLEMGPYSNWRKR